ncbi:hypothetical protein WN55_09735 [Dufourea novaeangliae]|uniref:Uncharacterized protein n=1 Tax=Dufourea novaeangliae TaxID=178035 RepID=A0A154NZ34_DUFNO|nr:hypothetical protein WN55_09735 [Dufourea novaeangliae]
MLRTTATFPGERDEEHFRGTQRPPRQTICYATTRSKTNWTPVRCTTFVPLLIRREVKRLDSS